MSYLPRKINVYLFSQNGSNAQILFSQFVIRLANCDMANANGNPNIIVYNVDGIVFEHEFRLSYKMSRR